MRKKRSDSIEALAEVVRARAKGIAPPSHVHLREGDLPFWESIVRAREANEWTTADLENAANLARCKADIERLQSEIDAEGDVIENQRGTQIINPKHTLLETLSRRAVALSRMLHVHAEATAGESRHEKARKKGRATLADVEHEDPLIPGLRAVK